MGKNDGGKARTKQTALGVGWYSMGAMAALGTGRGKHSVALDTPTHKSHNIQTHCLFLFLIMNP